MNLDEAKSECQRWLAYLERQKEKSLAVQRIAAERRAGTCTVDQGRERLAMLDRGVTVYDGAKLAEAVTFLLKCVDGQSEQK